MKIALLAGTQSGCGKTTIMLALLRYLKQQNYRVTSFKSGPDFLDPLWHQCITQRVSYNLDTRMVGAEESRRLINNQHQETDIALIEGVMGLFDGRTGVGLEGSSADLAKELSCPVILVVNAKGISGSIVPLVSGFCEYAHKMGIKISGIVANHIGSAHHAELLKTFLQDHSMPPLLAWMEKGAPTLPERHLGLTIPKKEKTPNFLASFHVDDNVLASVFADWQEQDKASSIRSNSLSGKKIAIAKDAACCFIYQANIDWLKAKGAELAYFSILNSDLLPNGSDALWIPGGYPELFGQQLSVSTSWDSINQFIEDGKPILAECGGSMLLGKQLIDLEGKAWAMAGVLDYSCRMQKKLVSLGYREDVSGMKGHEFHYSTRENADDLQSCFDCARGDKGIRYKNLRLSYIHWYFSSASDVMVRWLTERCRSD